MVGEVAAVYWAAEHRVGEWVGTACSADLAWCNICISVKFTATSVSNCMINFVQLTVCVCVYRPFKAGLRLRENTQNTYLEFGILWGCFKSRFLFFIFCLVVVVVSYLFIYRGAMLRRV